MYKTEQENFWAGDFGDKYIGRNNDQKVLSMKIGVLAQIFHRGGYIGSCLEFGSNIGLNLRALGLLIPGIKMEAVEINEKAANECAKIPDVKVHNTSILEFDTDKKFDLTFTSGVLIHINPDELQTVYKKLYDYSQRYVMVSEYYNPTPVEVNYRGNKGRLFKRDFAGEMMDMFPDLHLVDYGFIYHRDWRFPEDDSTWFLMEKR